jgi:hypothetical protein
MRPGISDVEARRLYEQSVGEEAQRLNSRLDANAAPASSFHYYPRQYPASLQYETPINEMTDNLAKWLRGNAGNPPP